MISVADGSVRVLKSAHYVRRYRPRIMFSPDGNYIAYDYPQQPENANGDVYILPVGGGRENVIASHTANDRFLGWSPDGNRIVFLSDRSGTNVIWTVAIANGRQAGEPEVASSNVGDIQPMGITKDGSLYYTAEMTKSNVYTVDIDAAAGKILKPASRMTQQFTNATAAPAWSPDGEKVAFLVRPDGRTPLLSVMTTGGEERHVLPQATIYGQLRWSPDGESILVSGEVANKHRGLVLISASTGEASLLAEEHSNFDWAPDGRRMFIAVRGVGIQKLVSRDIGSGSERVLYSGNVLPRAISVSPDGRQVAFVRTRSLCVIPADGGEVRVLFETSPDTGGLPWQSRAITWTPDSSRILFLMGKRGDMAIWSISAAGGSPVKTGVTGCCIFGGMSFSTNGRTLAYTTEETATELWSLNHFLHA